MEQFLLSGMESRNVRRRIVADVVWMLNEENPQGQVKGLWKSGILNKSEMRKQCDQSNETVRLFSTILHETTLTVSVITVHFQTSNLKPRHD